MMKKNESVTISKMQSLVHFKNGLKPAIVATGAPEIITKSIKELKLEPWDEDISILYEKGKPNNLGIGKDEFEYYQLQDGNNRRKS